MKKILVILAMFFVSIVSMKAMSYEQARQQALFLTDKMAYELNLTEAQYEAAFEINLDYLMSVNTVDDVFGDYWAHRNIDFSYILLDWQYRAFCDAVYFYRPLYWNAGYWHFRIYTRYPHRNYFYFGRPHFWTVYRGGHSWHHNGGKSWYHGRDFGRHSGTGNHQGGMRDRFDRGEWKNKGDNGGLNNKPNHDGQFNNGKNNRGKGDINKDGKGNNKGSVRTDHSGRYSNQQFTPNTSVDRRSGDSGRGSSTRTTVNQNGNVKPNTGTRIERSGQTAPRSTFTPNSSSSSSTRVATPSRPSTTTSSSSSGSSRPSVSRPSTSNPTRVSSGASSSGSRSTSSRPAGGHNGRR